KPSSGASWVSRSQVESVGRRGRSSSPMYTTLAVNILDDEPKFCLTSYVRRRSVVMFFLAFVGFGLEPAGTDWADASFDRLFLAKGAAAHVAGPGGDTELFGSFQ